MHARTPLATLLRQYLWESGLSLEQLARRSGVSKKTLEHWLRGEVARPYYWTALPRVASALGLNAARTNALLRAAGHPPLDRLLATTTDPDLRHLLAHWDRAAPNNLPGPLTALLGRDDELLELAELLSQGTVRLVTLTGPGGSGKTRLALAVARLLLDTFPDGVYVVPLAPLRDPALVLPTLARTLGVRETAGEPMLTRLVAHLRQRRLLLVLDNCEHLLAAAPRVVELLAAAPGLTVLATSRVPLHVSGEQRWPVEPLPLPHAGASLADLRQNPAIQLFVARAQAVNPAFALTAEQAPAVAALCARLDGLPLALELAAARVEHAPPTALLARFPHRLDLATDGPRDVARRQQTLRDTIGWSVDLLDDDARILFRRLAVFAGGWTRDAAMAVRGVVAGRALDVPAALAQLHDAHLLDRADDADGEPRYGMLETIREYALEHLTASGEAEALSRRHAAYFLAHARPTERYVPSTPPGPWLKWMAREHDNLRAALAWALARGRGPTAARLANALWPFWHEQLHIEEGVRQLRTVLTYADALSPFLHASLLTGASSLTFGTGLVEEALTLAEAALLAWRRLDGARARHGLAVALLYRGIIAYNQSDFAQAHDALTESLALWHALDEPRGLARCLSELGMLAVLSGRYTEAEATIDEAEALYIRAHDDLGGARCRTDRGLAALLRGDLNRARWLLTDAVALNRQINNWHNISYTLCYLGIALVLANQPEEGRAYLAESLRLRVEAGDRYSLAYMLFGLAGAALRTGQPERAARIASAASAIHTAVGAIRAPGVEALVAHEVALARERLGDAAFAAAWAEGQTLPVEQVIAEALGEPTCAAEPAEQTEFAPPSAPRAQRRR